MNQKKGQLVGIKKELQERGHAYIIILFKGLVE